MTQVHSDILYNKGYTLKQEPVSHLNNPDITSIDLVDIHIPPLPKPSENED